MSGAVDITASLRAIIAATRLGLQGDDRVPALDSAPPAKAPAPASSADAAPARDQYPRAQYEQ